MTILFFEPHCKDDECPHDYESLHLTVDMLVTEAILEQIMIELDDHHYHYVMDILDILGFYGCDFTATTHQNLLITPADPRAEPRLNRIFETLLQYSKQAGSEIDYL